MSHLIASFLLLTACCNASTVLYSGPDSVDTFEWVFPGFTADTMIGVFDSNPGPVAPGGSHAKVHDHAFGPTTFGLQLLVDGSWIDVASFTTTGANFGGVFIPYPLPSGPGTVNFIDYAIETAFPGPASFSSGVVSGIRLHPIGPSTLRITL
jgi:hypothetical protein